MDCVSGCQFRLHAHPNIELVYCLRGELHEIRMEGPPITKSFPPSSKNDDDDENEDEDSSSFGQHLEHTQTPVDRSGPHPYTSFE